MSRRDRQIRICSCLIILMLCFIWGNSLMPAEASLAFSDGVRSLLEPLIPGRGAGEGSSVLRKIAHFAEFAVLGGLLRWLVLLLRKNGRYALLWGLLAACIDETIQLFVPGRGPGLTDVGIDTCGVAAGMLLLQIGYVYVRRKQQTPYGGK